MTRSNPTRSGRTLVWKFNQTLASKQKARLHVVVRAPRRLGRYRSNAVAQVQTAAGTELTSRSPATVLRIKRRIVALTLRITGDPAKGEIALRGFAASRFGRGITAAPATARARGTLVFTGRPGTRVVLQVRGVRLERFAAPTSAQLALRVASVRGLGRCQVGARATLLVVDSAALRADGRLGDSVALTLPSACGGKRPKTTAGVGVTAS
jgi:hypothetical protein